MNTIMQAALFLGNRPPRRTLRDLRAAATKGRPFASVAAGQTSPADDEPAGLFAADEIPSLGEIEADAAKYARAADQARAADRAKRAARKILDRLPAGRYGAWCVERVPNAREVGDLEAIRKIFKANGLGEVPMKPCAPSLKLTRVIDTTPEAVEADLRALAGVR